MQWTGNQFVCVSNFLSEIQIQFNGFLCYQHLTDRFPYKVVLHPAEEWTPGNEEHKPDEDHTDLVQDGAGRGRHLLGHGDS